MGVDPSPSNPATLSPQLSWPTCGYRFQYMHRAPQPYQNVASLPHNPQSRPLNNNQTPQQSYGSPNVFTPQSNIHSPFLNSQPPFPGHQASSDAPNYYQPNQSPRSQSSGVG